MTQAAGEGRERARTRLGGRVSERKEGGQGDGPHARTASQMGEEREGWGMVWRARNEPQYEMKQSEACSLFSSRSSRSNNNSNNRRAAATAVAKSMLYGTSSMNGMKL